MVIFGLFGHEDQTFFIFWYKSKQDASIELKLLNTFSMTNLDTLDSYLFGSLVVGTQK